MNEKIADQAGLKLNRRAMLRQMAIAPYALRAGVSALPIVAAPTPALAFWPLALTAINTAVGVIGAFTSSDGGMSAMLSAINQKIDIVVGEVNKIQIALNDLNIEIKKLPEQFKTIILSQYNTELIDKLVATAQSYSEIRNAAANDPNIMQDVNIRDRVKFLSEETQLTRQQLSGSSGGKTPETVFIIPMTMFLEIATLSHLEFPVSFISEVIKSYRTWLNDCVSEKLDAIPARRLSAIQSHDMLVNDISSKQLGHLFEFSDFSFAELEKERSKSATDQCLMFSQIFTNEYVKSHQSIVDGLTFAANSTGGTLLERLATVRLFYDPAIGTFQFVYEPGITLMTLGRNLKFEGFGPLKQTTQCHVANAPFIDDVDKAIEFMTKSAQGIQMNEESKQMLADLETLNVHRSRIELCKKATFVAFNCIKQAEAQLSLLGAN